MWKKVQNRYTIYIFFQRNTNVKQSTTNVTMLNAAKAFETEKQYGGDYVPSKQSI